MSALLVAGLFTIAPIAAPQMLPRSEAAAIGSGNCVQDVGSTTGVTVTQSGNDCIVTFTSRTATTWKAPAGVSTVRYLVVGGGASSDRGNCGIYWGRGGGGGQVRDSTLSVVAGTNYSVTVGKGGDGKVDSCPNVGGNNGVASQFSTIVASPGLGGEANTAKGGVSGSGLLGGVGAGATLGAGGGGGAGVAGSGKNGGAGVNSDITGSTIMYGSGGAGRDNNGTGTASSGGATGSSEAIANRGGGGADYSSGWYAGADGVVIIRYTAYIPMTFPQVAYNPTTLSVGAGIGGRSDTFTATGGSGTRTFALTPVRSGFSIDTSTANGAALVVSSLVATGTYLETITVTDGAGFSVNHVVTVTVAAPVKWSVDNPSSLTTTYGTAASSRLNITGGTTGRVVTLTKPTTVPLNGITIDTSTAISSNYVTLNVSTRVLPGTYSLTVSVIDSSRIRSNQSFTVNINKLPSLSFTNGIAETTTVVRSGLHLQYELGQSYSGTGTTVLDLSGNNRNGFIVDGTPYSSSLGGGSVAVNATQRLRVQPGVITNSDSMSRFYWIYPRSATQTLVTVCNSNCGYIESELELSNSRLFARVWNLTSVSTQETLTLNTWHYVGYIYEAGTKTTSIYINGQLSASAVSTGTRDAPSGDQYELMGYNTTTNMQTGLQGNYSLGSVHYYKRVLTEAEIFNNYAATAPRFLSTAFPGLSASGSATITTTQGVTSSHSLFTATEGTGGKVITLSSATAGVTLDTSTANSAILNIANTVAATNSTTQRTISTSVVATDSVSATTTYPLTLRINPPVLISASIPLTLSTTFGRIAYDTFTATQGTGNKTFTGVSSSFQSAFVVSNPSANVGLLTVANNLPVGTYLETITATDSVGATTNYVLTVVVNPAPTIAGATGNTLTTTVSRSGSMRINVIGGTGPRTISWTSPNVGITIDSSTITSQNFITLNVSAAVPIKTYSFVISAIDSTSARVSDTFSVIVNRWPVIGDSGLVASGLRLNLDPSNYSGSGTWFDSSGNGFNAIPGSGSTTPSGTSPTFVSESEGYFRYGTSGQSLQASSVGSMETFTVSAWVRVGQTTFTGNPALVAEYSSGNVNFLIQFFGGKIVGSYRSGGSWIPSEAGFVPDLNVWMYVTYVVVKNGPSSYSNLIYKNGVLQQTTASTAQPSGNNGVVIIGRRWDATATTFTGDIGAINIYNRSLSATEILQNYYTQGSRFYSTNSGRETLTVTQGVAGSLSGVVASQGTGTKTLTLSNTNAGISIDTPTANTFSLALANTLTATSTTVARILTETVTATDTAGAATTRVYSVVVNPPVIETATSTSIATTSGIETTTVIYATQGTGNKTFALSGASSGFTLTSGVNQATLRVLSTANPGTYNLTVTATDSLGANTSLEITVVVAPPPTLLGVSRIEMTQGVGFTSPIYAVSGGTGSLSMTIINSPLNSKITLTGVTASGGYILVESSTATGTFLSTIRVTDARGSYSELVVTIVVNAPITLSGSLSLTKTYGNSVSSGYSTNGTGTAPFSFSATPVCAVVKTVSGSYTYERINGTDSCTWTAPVGVSAIDALIVGAGGGGGGDGGSGGGGGSINTLSSVTLPANRTLTVQVGTGGTGGAWGGPSASVGGTTTLTSGSTSYTAPGGAGGGTCGSAAASGGIVGSGGTGTVGGNSGFGGTGLGCGAGTGGVGSSGPASSFTGSSVNYGGGGGGGPFPDSTASIGGKIGGAGGGGTGAVAKGYTSSGLSQYFRTFSSTPSNANTKPAFISATCAVTTGIINYSTDSEFPCAQKDNFQAYAAGYFVAPVTGNIKFYLRSDDSSHMAITISGTTQEFSADNGENNATYSMVKDTWYPISVFFTEMGGLAIWKLEYEYTGQGRTPIPSSQLKPEVEGLSQYFKKYSSQPALASAKTVFTNAVYTADTCGGRVGTINYSTDSEFPCAQKDNFHGYATGYFVAPHTGDITFVLNSDDSSYLTINIDGTTREFGTTIGEVSATYSGFVKGRYYPISVFFTEIAGGAVWKLSYEYTGQSRTIIPTTYLRTAIDYTSPTAGTNGLGGGGGAGSAGLYKLNGASGGSGTAILKYLTQSETATQTMITAIVNQQTPSGLLTLNVPEFVNVGTYTETITVQDAANSPSYRAVVTITINKATPTLALSLPGSVTTAKYGNAVTISAVTTTPGRVAFVNGSETITACSSVATSAGLATCSWTPTAVGSTTLRAQLTPTDTANYNSSALTNLAITVAKADTLTVTVSSLTRQYTGSAVSVTGAFATTGLVAIDSLTAISMLYSGTANTGTSRSATTAPTDAGTYTIAPNFPANASAYTFVAGTLGTTSAVSNYESVTVVAGTLTINRAPQVMSFIYPDTNTATYSPTGTITATATTRLDGATRSYSSSTLTKCTIDSSTAVISIIEAGSCQVSMAVEQTFNYLADTATVTVTINKSSRTFSLTPALSTVKYSESTTVTATLSAGALDGTISYTLGSPAGCTFDPLTGELVATSGTIQCPLTATISEGINYLAETTTAISLTIARADAPVISIDTVTALSHTPGVRALVTPTFTVSGLKNSDAANSLSFTYSFISNPFETFAYSDTQTPIDAGTYRITPSALTLSTGLMSNYETPTYSSSAINFIINRINQETITVLNTNGEIEVPFTLTTSGGSTGGALTYSKISGDSCSVTGSSLTATAAGRCVITVTMAGNRNFLPITSETITVRVRNFVIVIVSSPTNTTTGIAIAPVTPIVKGPSVCTTGCVPRIISADIYEGVEGDLVVLTGTGFNGVTKVFFNIYTEAPNFSVDSDTQISVRVPAALPVGDATIEVISPGGTSARFFDFYILP